LISGIYSSQLLEEFKTWTLQSPRKSTCQQARQSHNFKGAENPQQEDKDVNQNKCSKKKKCLLSKGLKV
jgi:hypothetical protein